jgi:Fe-S oxidoreductase
LGFNLPENIKDLMEKLSTKIKSKNILTEQEHLYVYSRIGPFGIKNKNKPIAVIKIKPEKEEEVKRLLSDLDILVIGTNEFREIKKKLQKPYILLDFQEPFTVKKLENIISILYEEEKRFKQDLKQSKSYPQRLIKYLQSRDGYKISRAEEDQGFCILQSYFNDIQTYSSKGRLILSKALQEGDLSQSETLIDSIYSCTACGQCYDQLSLDSLEINNALIKTRYKIAQEGNVPIKFEIARKNIREFGNPMGLLPEDRTLWIEEEANKHFYEDNPVLYWAGCVTSYRLPEIIKSTTRILEKIGTDFGMLAEKEGCCGLLLCLSGHWEGAVDNGRDIIGNIPNVEHIITSCAGCYYAFSRLYQQLGLNIPFKVSHTSHVIQEAIESKQIRLKNTNCTYFWHDPCDLGRHCKVYEPPRDVLRSIPGVKLTETNLNREHAVCCGAGGGLWLYNEDATNYVSNIKITEATPNNIDAIITGCPTCILSMRNTVKEKNLNLEVLDLVEVIDNCLL